MKDWKKTLISPTTPLMEAIRIIDESALQITLVIDDQQRLIGMVTAGIDHGSTG
jgi:CBS domain-containing protein